MQKWRGGHILLVILRDNREDKKLKEWIVIHKIKAMYDEGKGLSMRAIARELGISRNTVRKYLSMGEEVIEARKSQGERSKVLDQHREYIIHLLQSYPGLSAVKIRDKLLRKHPELSVSSRTVRRYVRRVKESISIKQKRYYEPVLDMEPGVQCQVDGGEFGGLQIGGKETRVYFVVFVLSYSRLMYVGVSREPVNTEKFIQMHDAAFRYFGGCPEECVYDQTKLVVIEERFRELKVNERFHAYATAAGFRVRACEGYDPESKGKVEAGVKYVKRNALYGESFRDWQEFESYLLDWLNERANKRVHSSTGKVVREHFEECERSHMRAYFTPGYLMSEAGQEVRKADKTGLIAWKSNRYSVPMAYQRARVGVKEKGQWLIISELESGKEIARHVLSRGRGEVIKNTNHYRDREKQIADYEAEIKGHLGEEGCRKICELLKETSPRIYKDQLAGLVKLLKRYEMPEELLSRLCGHQRLTASQIQDYLEAWEHRAEDSCEEWTDNPTETETNSYLLEQYAGVTGKELSHEIH